MEAARSCLIAFLILICVWRAASSEFRKDAKEVFLGDQIGSDSWNIDENTVGFCRSFLRQVN